VTLSLHWHLLYYDIIPTWLAAFSCPNRCCIEQIPLSETNCKERKVKVKSRLASSLPSELLAYPRWLSFSKWYFFIIHIGIEQTERERIRKHVAPTRGNETKENQATQIRIHRINQPLLLLCRVIAPRLVSDVIAFVGLGQSEFLTARAF